MPGPAEQEQELIQLMQAGDRKAFERLYDWYAPALFGIATRLADGNSKVAEQVLQHSFIYIWQNKNHYRPGEGGLFAWMLRCLRASAQLGKEAQELRAQAVPAEARDQDGMANHMDTDTCFQDKVLELTFIFGASPEESGRLLNTSPETVKAGLRNAINRLKATA